MSVDKGADRAKTSSKVSVRTDDDYADAVTPSFEVKYTDSTGEARSEKLKKNPLVPAGAFVTAAVLFAGLYSFNRGNSLWSQRMMRARVVAQGATLGILAASVYKAKASTDPDDVHA